MNKDNIIKEVAQVLTISEKQITTVLKLLEEGNTVPFISRYRKEMTQNLNEDEIREIYIKYEQHKKIEEKKEETIRKIKEKGLLTPELENEINNCLTITNIEDIYLPFKEKKKTKATEAIKLGLEPLAKYIMALNPTIEKEAQKYITQEVPTQQEAITQASYIIAEKISENSKYRDLIRNQMKKYAKLTSTAKKNIEKLDEKEIYKIYYDFSQNINKIPSYRILAINRAEKEKIVTVSLDFEEEYVLNKITKKETKEFKNESTFVINNAIEDAYKRLILPSLKREIRKDLKIKADQNATKIFSQNLEKLLLQKPLKNKWVLGIDPAYRTGCKIAVVDANLNMIETNVIFPHKPILKIKEAQNIIQNIIQKYPIEQIVIGNGTASRETEEFVEELNLNLPYSLISEAGASVYSASKLAAAEFPDLTVEYRSAISIARRIQDPMAEIVKIDPKSIGIGQYQHDVDQKSLTESLNFTTEKVVNQVGVDLNTASKELLQYISGLDKKLSANIVEYRQENGEFQERKEIKNVPRLGEKAYEQCAGFLKILNKKNPLDETFIHPSDYEYAKKIINIAPDIKEKEVKLSNQQIKLLMDENEVSYEKILELVNYLKKPNLDIRDEIKTATFSKKIREIKDLKLGDKIQGEVRNIVEFGAFVDVGLKNDALIHISQLSPNFVHKITDVLQIGDIKEFTVHEIFEDKNKIQLTLLNKNK